MVQSGYLKRHQAEYDRRLSAVLGEGDWEGWVAFFLEGVAVAAAEAERSIIDVASLIAADRRRLLASSKAGLASYRLFERRCGLKGARTPEASRNQVRRAALRQRRA